MTNEARCGYVAIIGRPNVGKSTLLNHLLNRKISITSHKAQTTRHRILGVKTKGPLQTIYVDTPGLHSPLKRQVNRLMNRTVRHTICDVDVIVFVVDVRQWTSEDDLVLKELKNAEQPVLLVINKVDLLKEPDQILKCIAALSSKMNFFKVIPVSALKTKQIDVLERAIQELLPVAPHVFRADQVTDRDDRFLIAEIIREQILRLTHQELPYESAVVVESSSRKEKILHIAATIWVERPGQKAIIIGRQGEKLKEIGRCARLELEKLFMSKVFLSLWVKVHEGWTNDLTKLTALGIGL